MTNVELRRKMFDASGQQKVEINEDTEFDVPIKVKDYEANNMKELRELFECNVINLRQYENFISQLEMGEIGIIKKRKKYKELYEEEVAYSHRLIVQNNEMAKLIREIEKIAIDNGYTSIIEKIASFG